MTQSMMAQVLSLYASASVIDRLHLAIRWYLCPFDKISGYVPKGGLIVDVGCGHGAFAALLALRSPQRQVLGVEVAAHKLRVGRLATAHLPNLLLVQGNALAIPARQCQAITILDVAYLMPPEVQETLLAHCHERLAPGGTFLLKDVDTKPYWKFWLCNAEEWFVGRLVSRLTGQQFHVQPVRAFYYRQAADWAEALRRIGFRRVQTVRLDQGLCHPHVLIISQKG